MDQHNIRLIKALDSYIRFYTPPPDDLEEEVYALRKRFRKKTGYARIVIELCGDLQSIEAMELIIEACDSAGPSFAKNILKWAPRYIEAAGDFSHCPEQKRTDIHSRTYQILARAYEATEQYNEAESALIKSFQISNSYGHSSALVSFYLRMDRVDDAIMRLEECRALHYTHKAYLESGIVWEPRNAKQTRDLNTYLRGVHKSVDWRLAEIYSRKRRQERGQSIDEKDP